MKKLKFTLLMMMILFFGLGLDIKGQGNKEGINIGESKLEKYQKKEILFLKWGKGKNEIGLKKVITPKEETYNDKEFIQCYGPSTFYIDEKNNIFIDDGQNKRIFIVDNKKTIKTIYYYENDFNISDIFINKKGDLFFIKTPKKVKITKNNKPEEKLIFFSTNGKKFEYKKNNDEPVVYVRGNKFFSNKGEIIFEIKDKNINNYDDNKPIIVMHKDIKIDFFEKKEIRINTTKIKEWIKNKDYNDDLIIHFPTKGEGIRITPAFIDFDKSGNIYISFGYTDIHKNKYIISELELRKYDLKGNLLSIIPLELDMCAKDSWENFIRINDDGDVFYMWSDDKGVHLEKWEKEK
ncbi:MAG: hypothetical protein QXJ06_03580 [Candidatus Aenigmatarchaeota archaeon]